MGKQFRINMIFVGVGLGALYWLLETVFHVFIYRTGSFLEELVPSEPHDFIVRILTVSFLFFFGMFVENTINKRKQAEEKLNKSSERLSRFMNSATDNFLLFNSELDVIEINEAALKQLGLSKKEIIGKNILFITPNLKESGRYDKYVEVMKTGNPFFVDDIIHHPKFGDLHLALKAFKVGEGLGIIASDITERKAAEEALRASEEQYFMLFNNANELIQIVDPTGKILAVNKKWLKTLEYSQEEVINLQVFDIIRKDKLQQVGELMQKIKGGKNIKFETIFISKSGKEFIVEGNGNGIFKDGKFISMIGMFRDITERKKAEEEKTKIYNSIQTAIYIYDFVKSKNDYINPEYTKMLGWTLDDINKMGNKFTELFHPDDFKQVVKHMQIVSEATEDNTDILEYRFKHKNGQWRWCLSYDTPFQRKANGDVEKMIGSFIDITERKKLEDKLQKHERELAERVKELNCLYGISKLAERPGVTLDEMIQNALDIIQSSWQYPEATGVKIILDENEYKTENSDKLISKQTSYILIKEKRRGLVEVGYTENKPEKDEGPFLKEERKLIDAIAGQLGKMIDIKLLEEKLKYSAMHDPLTNLPNRRLFYDRMSVSMAHAQRYKKKLAVMMLDLDDFKKTNDVFGHNVGDKVLKIVAARLTGILRKNDTVSRIGGDELILLLPEIVVPSDAIAIAEKVLDSISKAITIDKQVLNITVSIGVVIYPKDGEEIKALIKKADIAMYRAKEMGRNRVELYAD